MTNHTGRHNPIGWAYFGQPLKGEPPMTDHLDRELKQTIREVAEIYEAFLEMTPTNAALLTLATVTHHQNGMKP